MENWRTMPVHSFGFQVQCGACEAWVTQVAAKDVADATAGKGRCHECVAKSPVVVEALAPADAEGATEMALEEDDPGGEDAGAVVPGAIEKADPGEPEGTPVRDEEAAEEEHPRKRR